MMKFKQFEFRPSQPDYNADGHQVYELVKWNEGDLSCFTIAMLARRADDDWEFRSVGMRYFKHWEYGLERYISACCDLVDACTVDEADV